MPWRLLVCLLLGTPAPAAAQIVAGLAATSDYRWRGQSFSNERPALTASLGYDHPSGFYAGGTITGETTSHDGLQLLGHSEYGGYAGRLSTATSWEIGAANTRVFVYAEQKYSVDYVEIYAGLNGRHLSAHVYYAPDYLDSSVATLYFDLGATLRLSGRLRAFGHAGLLVPISRAPYGGIPDPQHDLRAGVAARLGRFELQLAWSHSGYAYNYLTGDRARRDAVVIGASCFF